MRKLDTTIFKELAIKYSLDPRLVQAICTYPFQCIKRTMESDEDHRDILLAGLFRIKLKGMFKADKTKPYYKTKCEAIYKAQAIQREQTAIRNKEHYDNKEI